jgi:hypothetical protein
MIIRDKIASKMYILSASLYANSGLCVASWLGAYMCHSRIYVEARFFMLEVKKRYWSTNG